MQTYLVELRSWPRYQGVSSVFAAVEYNSPSLAMRVADRIWKRGQHRGRPLRSVVVRDPMYRVMYGHSVSSRMKGR